MFQSGNFLSNLKPHVFMLMLALMVSASMAQDFREGIPDSAYIDVFNGENFAGLYTFTNEGLDYDISESTESGPFSVGENGQIEISGGGNHIAPIKKYAYYHMRVDYKFGSECTWNASSQSGNRCNAGIMWHIDETKPKCFGDAFPASVECQMYQGDAANLISICGVSVTMDRTSGQWDSNGTPYIQTATPNGSDYDRYNYNSRFLPGPEDNQNLENYGDWNTLEVILMGDSLVIHYINDNLALTARDIRYTSLENETIPWGEGNVALQAEGAAVTYRNWQIADLTGCMDSTALNYKSYAIAENDSTVCEYRTGVEKPNLEKAQKLVINMNQGQFIPLSKEHTRFDLFDTRGKKVWSYQRSSESLSDESIDNIEVPAFVQAGLHFVKYTE